MRKLLTALFCMGGLSCVTYYVCKYYTVKQLCFTEQQTFSFGIIATIVILGLIIGIVNYLKIEELQKQNVELLKKLSYLSNQISKCHVSEMKAISSNMECILDLDKGDE